jgi:hypothetical protein
MAPASEMKSKSSQEPDSKNSNKLKEVDQLNSSDIGENLTKPQGKEELDAQRAVKEGDKYNIQGEEKKPELDMERETALSRLESRKQEDLVQSLNELQKQEDLGKNSLEGSKTGEELKTGEVPKTGEELKTGEVPKAGEEDSSRSSSRKDAIFYTIVSLAETFGMGVSSIVRGAVKDFGAETGGAGANGFSPADMLLLNRGMDPENLTKGMDPGEMDQERLTSEMDQERLTSEMKPID